MVYKIKEGFIVRKLGEQVMAVPVGQQTSHIHGMIALSESGELLWRALENGADEDALTDIITDNYEIGREIAFADVKKFIDGLKEQGVLE